MAILDKEELTTAIDALFADNISGDISAEDLRSYLNSTLDSHTVQRQISEFSSEVNITYTDADIDQNIVYILNPAPSQDQTVTLPEITDELVGRSLNIFLDYTDQQITLIPGAGNTIVGGSILSSNLTFLIIKCIDATRWLVQSTKIGSTGPDEVLSAESFIAQIPTALDTPLQIEFGPAQSNSVIDVDVNGEFIFHQVGIFLVKSVFNFTRTNSQGESYFFIRLLVNGSQQGNALAVLQTDDDITIPIIVETLIEIIPALIGVPFTLECMRDGQGGSGADSGQLSGLTSTQGWGSTPSARITISRF